MNSFLLFLAAFVAIAHTASLSHRKLDLLKRLEEHKRKLGDGEHKPPGGKLEECGAVHNGCMSDAGLDWEDPDMLAWNVHILRIMAWTEEEWVAAGTCIEGFAVCFAGQDAAAQCSAEHEACFTEADIGYGDDISAWEEADFDASLECGNEYFACVVGGKPGGMKRKLIGAKLDKLKHLTKKGLGKGLKMKKCGAEHESCMTDAGLAWDESEVTEWGEEQWGDAAACVDAFAVCFAGADQAAACGLVHESCLGELGLSYDSTLDDFLAADMEDLEACATEYFTCVVGEKPGPMKRKLIAAKLDKLKHLTKKELGKGLKMKICGAKHESCMTDAGLAWDESEVTEWGEEQWGDAAACVDAFAVCFAGADQAAACGLVHESCLGELGLSYDSTLDDFLAADMEDLEACATEYFTCVVGEKPGPMKRKLITAKLDKLKHLTKKELGDGKWKKCGDVHESCMTDAGLAWDESELTEWSEEQWGDAATCVDLFAVCFAGAEQAAECGIVHASCLGELGLSADSTLDDVLAADMDDIVECGEDYFTCVVGEKPFWAKRKFIAVAKLRHAMSKKQEQLVPLAFAKLQHVADRTQAKRMQRWMRNGK